MAGTSVAVHTGWPNGNTNSPNVVINSDRALPSATSRHRLRPEDAGLTPGPRRRVNGLRREELTALAGISADYYLRIEQGRHAHPSAQILDALARALRLDTAAAAHLHELARDDRPPTD